MTSRNKRVLVLGGATKDGIGSAIGDRLEFLGHTPFAPVADVVDVTKEDTALAEIVDMFHPDAVVYSVGINQLDWLHDISRRTFDNIMATNVWGFLNLIKVLGNTGHSYSVLAITSDAARRPMRTSAVYCASKAALDMAIRVASRELSAEGWRINGLAPGKVDGTPMTAYVDERVLQTRGWTAEQAEEYELSSSPIGRKLWTAEVAAAACDILLSDAIAWTGDIITVNGGR